MKIAIASKGKNPESQVHEKFGRADYFLITDQDGKEIAETINNNAKNNSTGAGIAAAQMLVDKNVEIVVAGNLGPKAEDVLNIAGIKFKSFAGSVLNVMKELLEKGKEAFQNNEAFHPSYDLPKSTFSQQGFNTMGRGRGRGNGCRNGSMGKNFGGGCRGMGMGMGRGKGSYRQI